MLFTIELFKIRLILGLFLSFSIWSPSVLAADTDTVFTFGVVPQQSASTLARAWQPILTHLGKETGTVIQFKTAKDIPTFEKALRNGEYDFSYMNPYHYVAFHESTGYKAIARRGGSNIKGIIVVKKDAGIHSLAALANQTIAFPSPAAFAASILPRAEFVQQQLSIEPRYVSSHDSVYLNVARGHMIAGGGIMRTLKALPNETREKLAILWTSKGYTPHAIAHHPRVDSILAKKLGNALTELHENQQHQNLLKPLRIKKFIAASNQDWDDVRTLKLTDLN